MKLTYKWGRSLCQEIFIFHEWAGYWRAPDFYERQETQASILWAKRFDHREATSVSLTWLGSPEYVRTRVVTNAARNVPELLGSSRSQDTRCHRGVCPGSTGQRRTSASSQPLPGSAAGTTAVQALPGRFAQRLGTLRGKTLPKRRQKEAGSKRGVVCF